MINLASLQRHTTRSHTAPNQDSSTAAIEYVPTNVRVCKRLFDIVTALVLLLATLPIWPLVMLAIKLESKGPIFFSQVRIGLANKNASSLFKMVKFRTMVQNAESATGPVWASKNDARITKVGKFMRKTRIDELPQLFNVLKGEMSMIGPRPERPGIMGKLENQIPLFNERTYGVLPGITGLAQVYQGYDETIEDSRNKLGYDLSYSVALTSMKQWLFMDALIVWKTIVVVIMGRGQ
ncbi:sugar transferase [Marinomonas mediterranea]|jgi:Sugar transferases involved in lipopolysaccharide synthesis|uniref:Sugar transferase n=1 Tax=Marinomonas mediterranea (strain ATCC 700492 / JCM 21426 / NBRC 103028 / MMB-1) TaxID=717774 RepID=F2K2H0_MARM1|nr:sugar transferase [Marinomonas mediterranea]ADZ90015.1 sugar transferase [Marinomonas mediterranea MMB-1]WCN08081.1 sugar transferase [Marinomonas mediterranea]WCN16223.1 sugar transferase [Marinomonas mediterranea MMB-1]